MTLDPTFEERLKALEAAHIALQDLPLAALQRKLELDWRPAASVLLGDSSITPAMIVQLPVVYSEINGSVSSASTTYVGLSGPAVTIPESGLYEIMWGSLGGNTSVAGAVALHGLDLAATPAADGLSIRGGGTQGSSARMTHATLAKGDVITSKYRTTSGTASWDQRWLRAERIA